MDQFDIGKKCFSHKKYQAATDAFFNYLSTQDGDKRRRAHACLKIATCQERLGLDGMAWLFRAISEDGTQREEWVELSDFGRRHGDNILGYWAAKQALSIPLSSRMDILSDDAAWGYKPYDLMSVTGWYAFAHDYKKECLENAQRAMEHNPADSRLVDNYSIIAGCMGVDKNAVDKHEAVVGTRIELLTDCNVALIAGDCGACSWVRQSRRLDYDRAMLDRIVPHIDRNKSALDIGAFIGSHTVEYLKHAKSVMSFEPNPAAFECLAHNCPGATRVNVALGDKNTTRYWTRIYPNCGASYLSDEPSPGCLTVPVRNLDSFEMLPSSLGFIKIDAEGEEVAILRGAKKTLLEHRPVMCIEVNRAALTRTGTSVAELVAALRDLNYRTEPIFPGGDTQQQYDILAFPLEL